MSNTTNVPRLDVATSLPELFRLVAADHPDAEAIHDDGHTLTYAELDTASDRLAARLTQQGVGHGDLVGLLLERSADIPVGILAVMKAGAAYVPLDPTYPHERLRYMVEDAGVTTVIGNPEQATERGLDKVTVLTPYDDGTIELTPPALELTGSEPAYVIYTSGSTGNPKGCVVTHHNVLSLLRGALPLFDVTADDRWALFHSFSFDVSVWEFWASMATGATAVTVPLRIAQSPAEFLGLLARQRVTVLGQVPSVFRSLAMAFEESGCPELALRYLVFAGESVDLDVVSAFLRSVPGTAPTAVNMYGPTETTVYATHRILTETDFDGSVRSPIGAGLPHLQLEIRDEDLRILPDGETGELLIAGTGVADGYLGRPELTAERFTTLESPQGPRRYYRTGDLARKLPDGSFEYLGRNDQQIKLRGHRIELGEVEAALRTHEWIRDVAATVTTTTAGATFFVACAVLGEGAPADPASELRRHAMAVLPRYMVPDRYLAVPELPLTGSGKLDRKALTALALEPPRTEQASAEPTGDPYIDLVAEVFAEILDLPGVAPDADFTSLGGSSLGAGRVCARLAARRKHPVPVSALYLHPTPAALGAWLHTVEPAAAVDDPAEGATGRTPLTPAQEGFLVRQLMSPADLAGHCLGAWLIEGDLDRPALALALADVHGRHPALHSTYATERGRAYTEPGESSAPDLVPLPTASSAAEALTSVRTALAVPLDPTAGRLWHTVLAPVADGSAVFGYVVHHVAFDGWSESVLTADLATAYNARRAGNVPDHPAVPSAAESWAMRAAHLRSADLDDQRARLKAELQGVPELNFPGTPGVTAAADVPEVLRVEVPLGAAETAALDRQAAAAGLTRFPLLLARYAQALAELTGQDDFGIGVPVAQRIDTRLESAVGCHIGTVCVRVRGAVTAGDGAAVAEAGRLVREAFACQDVGIPEVVRLVNPPRSDRSPFFQTLFAYQDNAQAQPALDGVRAEFVRLPYLGIPAEIQAEVWPVGDGLRVVINALVPQVAADVAHGLAKTFADLLRAGSSA
ncbi:amino acid adenylation domain-containing protein [Streptomyces sp. NBC_01356]|uniref:amino acid adenylation domain-containing protein n=1 Tax=Streptomyces sp. NBC_01356 TaxID=2903836 RepID=UPI002E340B13|nr:amino acid adenylation domain-containing protein [Streptomyces sp. NBC_01356]